ncbi:MAG TPA: S9 family peptidase, partial [candidate division Zixibacteria bacterium]|nr:S9 family peptidase [candidate division Zixibacteria bacterium]
MRAITNTLLIGSLIVICAMTATTFGQPAKLIPMRDFFKNPEKAYFQISPDGNLIASIQPYQGRMNIFVQTRGSDEAKRVTTVTDRDISAYFWKGNDRLLYLKDFGGDENFHLFAVDKDGAKEVDLTPFDSTKVMMVDDLKDHDTDVLVQMNRRNKQIFDVYRLNTVTGELNMVAENPGNITGWMTDHDGNIRIAVSTDGVNSSTLYRANQQDSFRVILTTNFKESFSPLFFTFDNKAVYAASNLGRDKVAIVKYDIANGQELEKLYDNPEVDVDGMQYSRKRKVLTEINYDTWKPQRKILDKETEAIYKALEAKFPGYEVVLTSNNKNEDIFTFRTYNDRTLGSYYTYEVKTGKTAKLADRNSWLNENDLVEMKPITYKTRDGLTINGYLSLPKGKDPKNLPVVINPHGGPWYRDTWTFNPEVQFLANRGYAVLQMNFRGSTGYGKKFWEASFKEWGKKMQDDISDGVAWLIDQKIADPKRVAIYGGSYGGYATLAG